MRFRHENPEADNATKILFPDSHTVCAIDWNVRRTCKYRLDIYHLEKGDVLGFLPVVTTNSGFYTTVLHDSFVACREVGAYEEAVALGNERMLKAQSAYDAESSMVPENKGWWGRRISRCSDDLASSVAELNSKIVEINASMAKLDETLSALEKKFDAQALLAQQVEDAKAAKLKEKRDCINPPRSRPDHESR